MYSINTLKELMFIGAPILMDDTFLVHPMKVKDRILMGEKYSKALNLLTLSSEDIEDILIEKVGEVEYQKMESITPFEYLLLSAENDGKFLLELKQAFSTFLREEVLIIPKAMEIRIGSLHDERKITKENFPELQKVLRLQNHLDVPEEIPKNENYMHKKFRLKRKLLKKAKAKQAAKDKSSPTFLDLMSSLCIMNVGITWDNIGNIPIFTFYELIGRNQIKEKYDTDLKSLLAGADSKKIKLKYWIRNSSEDD